VTDTTLNDWDAGFEFDDDPDPGVPTGATDPVIAGATGLVTAGVTGGVIPPVTGTVTGGAIPDDGDGAISGAVVDDDPIPAGWWQEPGAEPDQDGGLAAVITRLAALTKASPLLGGGSLAAELADPRPGTWGEHWQHVTHHKNLPDGTWGGIGFVAGHLVVTGPLKLTGKAMTATGNALAWTGTRANRASDHFASAVIFIVLAVAMTVILVIAAGEVISYLP